VDEVGKIPPHHLIGLVTDLGECLGADIQDSAIGTKRIERIAKNPA
jgi:hypothetical protein